MAEIAEEWGIGNVDLFASATLLKPYEGGDKTFSKTITGDEHDEHDDAYQMELRMRNALRDFLKDTPKMPRELVFIGRNMRIVQGNNQYLGSPGMFFPCFCLSSQKLSAPFVRRQAPLTKKETKDTLLLEQMREEMHPILIDQQLKLIGLIKLID